MTKILRCTVIAFFLQAGASPAFAAPVLHTADFISDRDRTHFNSFEAIPAYAAYPGVPEWDGLYYSGGNGPYVEGGIKIQQVNGDRGNDIRVSRPTRNVDGSRTWYPMAGTNGNSYVEITMADGSPFFDFGFYAGGGNASTIFFDLLLNGTSVLTGLVPTDTSNLRYLGFSGGGFDTIRVRDNWGGGRTVYDGRTSLILDALEARDSPTPVPEPGTLILFGLGLVGLGFITPTRNKGLNIR